MKFVRCVLAALAFFLIVPMIAFAVNDISMGEYGGEEDVFHIISRLTEHKNTVSLSNINNPYKHLYEKTDKMPSPQYSIISEIGLKSVNNAEVIYRISDKVVLGIRALHGSNFTTVRMENSTTDAVSDYSHKGDYDEGIIALSYALTDWLSFGVGGKNIYLNDRFSGEKISTNESIATTFGLYAVSFKSALLDIDLQNSGAYSATDTRSYKNKTVYSEGAEHSALISKKLFNNRLFLYFGTVKTGLVKYTAKERSFVGGEYTFEDKTNIFIRNTYQTINIESASTSPNETIYSTGFERPLLKELGLCVFASYGSKNTTLSQPWASAYANGIVNTNIYLFGIKFEPIKDLKVKVSQQWQTEYNPELEYLGGNCPNVKYYDFTCDGIYNVVNYGELSDAMPSVLMSLALSYEF